MKLYLKYQIVCILLMYSRENHAQVIVRLWEAEISASANIVALSLIKVAETKLSDEMKKLNTEIRKQTPYYGFMAVFDGLFEKVSTIDGIRSKLARLNEINNKVPLLFNRKKREKKNKWMLYAGFLDSLDKDLTNDFSNNGNLLKTALELTAELEKIEKEVDDDLEDLIIAERIFNLF